MSLSSDCFGGPPPALYAAQAESEQAPGRIMEQQAPKEKSLSCTECHSQTDSRLANLTGFYMPARDASSVIDFAGRGVALACLIGVLIHALGRMYTRGNGRKES